MAARTFSVALIKKSILYLRVAERSLEEASGTSGPPENARN